MKDDRYYADLARAAFTPRSIAVIGAGGDPRSLGSRRLRAILDYGYAGRVYAVNRSGMPSGSTPGVTSLAEIGEPVDYVLAAARYELCPAILDDADAASVPVVQILATPPHDRSPDQVRAELGAGSRQTRVIGPNSVGIHSAAGGFSFLPGAPGGGAIALLSQSGGLTVDTLRQASDLRLGIGCAVSMGNGADLGPDELLRMLGTRDDIAAIGCYIEGLSDGRAFVTAVEAITAARPVFVLRGGSTRAGRIAVASHTGSLTTDDLVWRDVLRTAGATEVGALDDLLSALSVASSTSGLRLGRRGLLIGNGGGMSVLAADQMQRLGLDVAELSEATRSAVAEVDVPAGATLGNPADVPAGALAAGGVASLVTATGMMARDEAVDFTLLHFNLGSFVGYANSPEIVAGVLGCIEAAERSGKPVFVCLRSTHSPACDQVAAPILEFCRDHAVPCVRDISRLIDAISVVNRWVPAAEPRSGTASPEMAWSDVGPETGEAALDAVAALVAAERGTASTLASQALSWAVLSKLGIGHPDVLVTRTAAEAIEQADAVAYPVVLKLDSPAVVHKSDVGGVVLGIPTPGALRAAVLEMEALRIDKGFPLRGYVIQSMVGGRRYETIVGARRDPVFGGIALAGAGGIFTELWNDTRIRMAPVSTKAARRMWADLRYAPVLQGYRGQPAADLSGLSCLTSRLSQVVSRPLGIEVIELNPVSVGPAEAGAAVLDCRIVLAPAGPRMRPD
jgi:acyl-CoA synthetase (NDP forming)